MSDVVSAWDKRTFVYCLLCGMDSQTWLIQVPIFLTYGDNMNTEVTPITCYEPNKADLLQRETPYISRPRAQSMCLVENKTRRLCTASWGWHYL
eukprot:2578424-Amphidinium_carterae.1